MKKIIQMLSGDSKEDKNIAVEIIVSNREIRQELGILRGLLGRTNHIDDLYYMDNF